MNNDELFTALISTLAAIEAKHAIAIAGYKHVKAPSYSVQLGKRYARLVRHDYPGAGGSSIGFVDMTTGDLLKSASWKAPAKGVRGNALRGDFACCNAYGIR